MSSYVHFENLPFLKKRSKRFRLISIAVVVIIVALVIGIPLGLRRRNDNDDDQDNNPNPTPTPQPQPPLPDPTSRPLWTPKVNDTWQIMLLHPPLISPNATSTSPDVAIFDVDLFNTPVETISTLHRLGKKVICYFSAGSYEPGRPDSGQFKEEDMGAGLEGWPGERWLQLSSENVKRIMKNRIDLAWRKGCDGVDPDNVDGYNNKNALSLTTNTSTTYLTYLSSLTTPLNLTLGLKNAASLIPTLLPIIHFSVNEQCVQYTECTAFAPFIAAGKPVFHIEYPEEAGAGKPDQGKGWGDNAIRKFCGESGDARGRAGFSTVLKNMNLDGWSEYCEGGVRVTEMNMTV
ncbi:glycoside hydrolase superfamily [Dendryphion nanum]|uniref:alpha-galactosidase n=1 Tax=Dendryphion nanum TaxID=256645 RepID=A0A9P9EJ51_9PLEO|nr:glycoside hydrolase superfamily [Dendryphion nanum]